VDVAPGVDACAAGAVVGVASSVEVVVGCGAVVGVDRSSASWVGGPAVDDVGDVGEVAWVWFGEHAVEVFEVGACWVGAWVGEVGGGEASCAV
jgi:hypothetical protein